MAGSELTRSRVMLCDKVFIKHYHEKGRVYVNIHSLYFSFFSPQKIRLAFERYKKKSTIQSVGDYLDKAEDLWLEENAAVGPDWYTCYGYVYLPKESRALTLLKKRASLTSKQ